jgi:single-stranded DNA-binding protein
LKARDGNHTQFWRIAAFSEPVQAELMRLTAGDAVAVEGALKAELYDRGGEIELSFGVIAEHVLPLRQPGQKQKEEGQAATHGVDASWPPKFLQRVPF